MGRPRKPAPSMKKVAEGIYRRPNGKYVVPVYDPQTRAKKYSLPGVPRGGFETLQEAKDFKASYRHEQQVRGSTSETADHFANRWVDDYPRPKESTNQHHRERIKLFARDFKGVRLGDITRVQARAWALEHPQHFRIVRSMFSDAARDGIVPSNPFARMGIPEGNGRKDILVLSEPELAKLADTAEAAWGDFGRSMIGPLIVFAAYTGLRPGELYALRWSNVDFQADEIQVKRQLSTKTGEETSPKNGKSRVVVLLPEAAAALKRIVRRTDHDYVFYVQSGARLTQRSHHYYWDAVRKMFWAGLEPDRQEEIDPGFDFYELRHFFGSLLAARDVSPYDIADQMGHVDGGQLAMERYIHIASSEARERIKDKFRPRPGVVTEGEQRRAAG